MIVTEHVVGRVGALMGAPVCEVAIVQIPEELAGWQFVPGRQLEPGLAHGSAAVDQATEDRSLAHRQRDDNQIRQAGVFALYDWCWGGDHQWLYSAKADMELYSHDHGFYLPPTGSDWNVGALDSHADRPHPGPWPPRVLDRRELDRLSAALRAIDKQHLCAILGDVPLTWPVTTRELEALGSFLECRAPLVAHRLDLMKEAM